MNKSSLPSYANFGGINCTLDMIITMDSREKWYGNYSIVLTDEKGVSVTIKFDFKVYTPENIYHPKLDVETTDIGQADMIAAIVKLSVQ